jgi:TonB family protein
MASPKEIAPLLPETLPADFSDWDGERSSTPMADSASGRKPTSILHEVSKPREQSEYIDGILASFRNSTPSLGSDSLTPVSIWHQSELEEWQREAAPASLRGSKSEREAAKVPSETPKAPEQSAERKAASSPAPPKPVFAKPQEHSSNLAYPLSSQDSHGQKAGQPTMRAPMSTSSGVAPANEVRESHERSKSLARAAEDVPFQFPLTAHHEVKAEEKTARKKWMIVAATGAGSILLIFMIALGRNGTKAVAKESVQPHPATIDTRLVAKAYVPPVTQSASHSKPQATARQITNYQEANEEGRFNSAPAPTKSQTKMMNAQLTAPRMISAVAENEPPPANLAMAGADGLGASGLIGSVLNGRALPVVKAAKPIVISSGVAAGMLIHKTEPAYPSIAKTARVSGTVELNATITKSGTLKDLRVVSGSEMLRQAALDAVQTWRYRPYKINNEPTEVGVTIRVVFSLTY